jgi:hypothetical protein
VTRIGILVLPLVLAGCVGAWPSGSYVQAINQADATALAPIITNYVGATLPAGSNVLLVTAPVGDPIASVLVPELDKAGFAQRVGGHSLSYIAGPLDSGVMLRVSVDNVQGASRYFIRDASGALVAGGPLTVATP